MADITINITVNPDMDIDSVASWLYDLLSECQEIEEVEVEQRVKMFTNIGRC